MDRLYPTFFQRKAACFLCISVQYTALLYGFRKAACRRRGVSRRSLDTALHGAECLLSIYVRDFDYIFLFRCALYAAARNVCPDAAGEAAVGFHEVFEDLDIGADACGV